MVLECKGIETNKYFLPPFDLREGEIVVLHLFNGQHSYETEMYLKDIFTGKRNYENTKIYQQLTFVEHFRESAFRRRFFPVTVGEYLKKHANPNSPFATRIYEMQDIDDGGPITEKTEVNLLEGTARKILTLCSTLSRTDKIIFDLVGQAPHGAKITCEIVKEVVKKGGSAILLDNFDGMKNDCSKYIELQWKDAYKPEPPPPFKIQKP